MTLLDYRNLVMHFDGMCEPRNPGGIAIASWVFLSGEVIVASGSKIVASGGPKATSNFAEWCSLGLGLRAAVDSAWEGDTLRIFGDSQLVVRQFSGQYAVNASHLIPLRLRALELVSQIKCKSLSVEWVLREQNEVADRIGRECYANFLKKGETANVD